YAGIDKARFKRPVEPGDQLMIEVSILGSKRGVWKFGCSARVGDTLVAEANILCTVRPAVAGAQ
ncbi:MAG: 3-hydroxyacyl-[acyl-carrier-protein] dehydratase FabZ, partial [Betaproteobacteria bacterium]|nr:3-hydroxyacyl-[acyl-carrier-protein] dehydratase FabZ [Betaproteobacteria bacterium]